MILYLLTTFLIVPTIAPLFGREKIDNNALVQPHSIAYLLANRNYVRPELNEVIRSISARLHNTHPGIQLIYLDGNFPFIDGFPLLPHLSHNDGKKLDITFIYKDEQGKPTNLKRSRSGYGVYESPTAMEHNQTAVCIKQGYWQYDFPKHLSFGKTNPEIQLDKNATKDVVQFITAETTVSKLFIEPHLKQRLGLRNSKIRFHGCQAVRHDDHIHFQIK